MIALPELVDVVVDLAIAEIGRGHVLVGECCEVWVHVADLVDAGLHLLLDAGLVDFLLLVRQGLEDDVLQMGAIVNPKTKTPYGVSCMI